MSYLIVNVNDLGCKKFREVHYLPDVTSIEEILKDKKYYENEQNVCVYLKEIAVEISEQTLEYNFYEIQTFCAESYFIEEEDREHANIKDWLETKYIAVRKITNEK